MKNTLFIHLGLALCTASAQGAQCELAPAAPAGRRTSCQPFVPPFVPPLIAEKYGAAISLLRETKRDERRMRRRSQTNLEGLKIIDDEKLRGRFLEQLINNRHQYVYQSKDKQLIRKLIVAAASSIARTKQPGQITQEADEEVMQALQPLVEELIKALCE